MGCNSNQTGRVFLPNHEMNRIQFYLLSLLMFSGFWSSAEEISIKLPSIIFENLESHLEIRSSETNERRRIDGIILNGDFQDIEWEGDLGKIPYTFNETGQVSYSLPDDPATEINISYRLIPRWMSIIPPLLAVIFALFFKEVVVSLILGIMSGGMIISCYGKGWSGMLDGFLMPIDFVLRAVSPANGSTSHISVIVFSLLIGGMVSIITANGSMRALVNRISKRAKTKKQGQFVTWVMGVLIFFDDYANTMVVGNTIRPLTDKLKISREKLAYIVDSTAAPIAAIALVTTWIGAELLYIEEGVSGLVGFKEYFDGSTYLIFLQSLKYSFYPFLTLAFILILIWTGKDFGPMLKAERAEPNYALSSNDNEPATGKLWKGLLPIAIILFGTLLGLFITGYDSEQWINNESGFWNRLSTVIGNSDSYKALLWSSFISVIVALVVSINQFKLSTGVEHVIDGFKKMLPAIVILVLAWGLAEVTALMQTAEFISSHLSDSLNIRWMPAVTFLAAALISFSIGSSWGTMAILYPVLIVTSWNIGLENGVEVQANFEILLNVIASVLAGSVLGDHCSPISDTTILSSLATDCDHIEHVRTQLPYALSVGSVSLIFGTIATSFGLPFWISFVLGLSALYFIVSYFGKMA